MTDYAGDITPTAAWELLTSNPDARLVDVRTTAEWQWVGIPDTSSLGYDPILVEWVSYPAMSRNVDFVDQLRAASIPEGAPLVFLCRSGQRSIDGATAATAAGFGPSYNILHGFEGAPNADGHRGVEGWKAEGLPWKQG
ncbi:rhodanese-like domain-containing protein [Demequina sp. B12]|uniref:rhodanese-like domain-containing protein n=1 Tax=Demequina sp. B12 TaxID=2992757 RepID=UPI00237A0F87|nr:rhodanese-like domain-containing protein [Demequina sp. B12]MDE0571954.1 rhodanese-like domain-containing protein [Demequina sp. B12]